MTAFTDYFGLVRLVWPVAAAVSIPFAAIAAWTVIAFARRRRLP